MPVTSDNSGMEFRESIQAVWLFIPNRRILILKSISPRRVVPEYRFHRNTEQYSSFISTRCPSSHYKNGQSLEGNTTMKKILRIGTIPLYEGSSKRCSVFVHIEFKDLAEFGFRSVLRS